MRKKGLAQSSGLVLLLALTLLVTSYELRVTDSFAEEETGETFTITTYYPSPYGSYNELSTNKFVVGDTDGDGKVTSSDQPPKTGSLYVAESVIYKPKAGDPATWNKTNARAGELAYSSSKADYYTFNGSTWVAQGGGSTYFLACTCPTGSTEIAVVGPGVSLGGALTHRDSPGGYTTTLNIAISSQTVSCCSYDPRFGHTNCVKVCKY